MISTRGSVVVPKAITDADGVIIGIEKDKEIRDKNWKKVRIEPFFDIISQLSKPQLQVLKEIMIICGERNNLAKCNTEYLSKRCNVSEKIAEETILVLKQNDFLRRVDSKKFMINPTIIYYGADNVKLKKQYFSLSSKYKLKSYNNKEWQKLWVKNFFEKIQEDVSGKSMLVIYCLLNNMYVGNNIAKLTQRQIADKTGLSLQLVNRTLIKLKNQDLIYYTKDEVGIRINPECVAGVSLERRLYIIDEYAELSSCS